MNITGSRSSRIRVKPLKFWDNERLKYDIHGELLNSSLPTLHSITQVESSVVKNRSSTKFKFCQQSLSKLKRKSNNALTDNFKENVKNGKKDETLKKNRAEHYSEKEKPNSTLFSTVARNTTTGGKESNHNAIIAKDCSVELTLISTSTIENELTNIQCKKQDSERTIKKIPLSKTKAQDGKDKRKPISVVENEDKGNLVDTETSDDDFERPLDMRELIYEKLPQKGPVKLFELTDMTEIRNEQDEFCFVENGPFDPNTGFCTGYLCLKYPTLHWGHFTTSKDICVLEGKGTLVFTQDETGDQEEQPIIEGSKYNICGGGEVLVRKDEDCPHLVLFVSFTHEDYTRRPECTCK